MGHLATCRAAAPSALVAKLDALEALLQFEEEDPGADQDGARWRLLASLKADLAAMAEADAGDLAEAA